MRAFGAQGPGRSTAAGPSWRCCRSAMAGTGGLTTRASGGCGRSRSGRSIRPGRATATSGSRTERTAMAEKVIRQQPVTLAHVTQVIYIVYQTGGVDSSYVYTPVDETGRVIGEPRSLTDSKSGAAATEIKNWITTKVLPEINLEEGT